MRSVEEWVGTHDDQAVPPRVKLRIFERYEGRCYLSGVKIRPGDKWEVEHIKALSLGGEHRESNMAPALVAAHTLKTRADRRQKAKNDRVRKRHVMRFIWPIVIAYWAGICSAFATEGYESLFWLSCGLMFISALMTPDERSGQSR